MTGTTRDRPMGRAGALGWLELVGVAAYLTIAFSVTTLPLVADVRNEHGPGPVTWTIALAVGAVLGLGSAAGLLWSWRRRGGREVVRLARRTVLTGEPPADPALRTAIVRELERREKALTNSVPAVVVGALWTVLLVLRVVTDHSVLNVLSAVLIWFVFAAFTAVDVVDRRRSPQRRRLLTRLHDETAERAAPVASRPD